MYFNISVTQFNTSLTTKKSWVFYYSTDLYITFLFKLKENFENMTYLGSSTCTFLEIFHTCDDERRLLCELFLHNIMCEYVNTKMVEIVLVVDG